MGVPSELGTVDLLQFLHTMYGGSSASLHFHGPWRRPGQAQLPDPSKLSATSRTAHQVQACSSRRISVSATWKLDRVYAESLDRIMDPFSGEGGICSSALPFRG